MNDKKQIEIKHGGEAMLDLLNQEQAELQKAMIEEMRKDICIGCSGRKCGEYCDKCESVAEELVKKYQPKLHENEVVIEQEDYDNLVERAEYAERELALKLNSLENAVVLTREEYEALKKQIEYWEYETKVAREEIDNAVKEKAREILGEVGKVCGDYQWFKNLRKQYGVEVDND